MQTFVVHQGVDWRMSSFIHYKFKSAKDFDTYRFEGAGVPVWELKQEIIQSKKLGKGMDFDLVILNAQTSEEYRSDSFIVPKNTSVLVKRVPGVKVRQYGVDHSQSADRRAEVLQPVQAATTTSFAEYFPSRPATLAAARSVTLLQDSGSPDTGMAPNDEEDQIAAMMDAHSAAWNQNQQQIGVGQESFRPRSYRPAFRPPPQMTAPPPPYYVCFRCGQKGHYIANCPTNADPNFDKPRLKKSTGIPRAFLKTVAGTPGDTSGGVLVTPDGSLVVAVSNDQEWQKISLATSRAVINPDSVPDHLRCKICSLLINEPVCCPACKHPFCDECIMKTGPAKELSCPNCHASFMAEQLLPADALKRDIEALIASQQKIASAPQMPTPEIQPVFRPPIPGMMFPFPPLPFPFPPVIPPPPPQTLARPATESSRPERSRSPPARKRNRSRSRSRSPSGSSKRPHLK